MSRLPCVGLTNDSYPLCTLNSNLTPCVLANPSYILLTVAWISLCLKSEYFLSFSLLEDLDGKTFLATSVELYQAFDTFASNDLNAESGIFDNPFLLDIIYFPSADVITVVALP